MKTKLLFFLLFTLLICLVSCDKDNPADIDIGIAISSFPEGASIYLDGTYLNLLTPAIIDPNIIAEGDHHIRIYLPGYNEINIYFTFEIDEYIEFDYELTIPVPPYPVFYINSPVDLQHFDDNVIEMYGNIELDNGNDFTGGTAILSINGIDSEIYVAANGDFYAIFSIASGENELYVRANGPNGDTGSSDIITVYGDFVAPEIEVVLWWNTPTSDIDLHAWNPAGEWCYFGNQTISDGFLDIDDTEGYGPETFAVQTANVGVYEIQVNCFDLDLDTYTDASIQVFFDGVLMDTYGPQHFIVDDGMGDDPEAWWEVCTITVENGRCFIGNKKPTPLVRDKIKLDKVNLPLK